MAYYGDDFTGSTDVLEALHSGGVKAVLFVEPPTADTLRRYPDIRAFGVAGSGRTMTPHEMEDALPPLFGSLRELRPRIVHYKVCSTFDSAPELGSIGKAIDLGQRVFENRVVPLAVGVPSLGRYCVFGNLFARSGLSTSAYRLDRHPTMQRHPVTPMNESDLRVHLAPQTSQQVNLVDVLTLDKSYEASRGKLAQLQPSGGIVLFDTLTDEHLETIGKLICDLQELEQKPMFVAGSSGVDYALVKHWNAAGTVKRPGGNSSRPAADDVLPVDRTVVLSGSCSPVTDRQIAWALENGFAEVGIDPTQFSKSSLLESRICSAADRVVSLLARGQSVIIHTCRGPDDERIAATKAAIHNIAESGGTLGSLLGRILRHVLPAGLVRRVAVVGGDTAGQVACALEVEAVQMIGPLEPGAPLCVVRSRAKEVDGLEITFKGGQVGYEDFFGTLLTGRRIHSFVGATI